MVRLLRFAIPLWIVLLIAAIVIFDRIGSDCAGSITSKVWQIDMSSIARPRVLTVTEFGGNTCFCSDPIIDPQGSGIAYFSDNNANNVPSCHFLSAFLIVLMFRVRLQVIAILPENGKWNSDLYLPLKSSSDMGEVDKERKQGFYLSKRQCGSLEVRSPSSSHHQKEALRTPSDARTVLLRAALPILLQ